MREPWVLIALAWWAWLVACTAASFRLPGEGWPALLQAVADLRFLVLVAALEHWVLHGARERRWFLASLALTTLYIAAQTLLQFAIGHNLFGTPRYGDGSLTGPFEKPRDGPTFVRTLFPVLLPGVGYLLARAGKSAHLAALALLLAGVGVSVLIGQRMPLILTALGLLIVALLIRRLRLQVGIAILCGGLLVAASSVVAPPTFYRLVTKFSRQIENFGHGPYGVLVERSLAIAGQHPWIGRGYDGFRSGCPLPRYFVPWHWPDVSPGPGDGGAAAICVTHPHNYYLQAVTDAGLPGLALFSALACAWLLRLGQGLLRRPDPLRVGLFVAACIQLWPLASTSAMQSIPIGAWLFLLAGFGLAEANCTLQRAR